MKVWAKETKTKTISKVLIYGTGLHQARTRAGLTMRDLAAASDISVAMVHLLEAKRRSCTQAVADRISKALKKHGVIVE